MEMNEFPLIHIYINNRGLYTTYVKPVQFPVSRFYQ